MHLLHWLVNEQVPQYYLISPTYANIRNKSVICVCMRANNSIRTETLFDYYTKTTISRPIPNGLSVLDAKTPTHSRTMRNRVQRTCTLKMSNASLIDWWSTKSTMNKIISLWISLQYIIDISIFIKHYVLIFIDIKTVDDVEKSNFQKQTFKYFSSDFSTLIFIDFSFLGLIFCLRVSKI